jgi:hypothetical protein
VKSRWGKPLGNSLARPVVLLRRISPRENAGESRRSSSGSRHTIAVSTGAKNTDAKNEAIEYSYGKKRKIDCAVVTGDVPIQYRSRLMPRARTTLRINVVVEPLLRMSQTKKYRQTRTAKRHGGNVSFDRDTHASCAATTPSLNASNNSNGSHLRYHKIDSSTREK